MGREDELESLHALLAGVRNADAGALLIHGDPGIGKTTLLDAALADPVGIRVLRAPGFAAESTLPYAGLQRLGRPLSHLGDGLPPLQRDALLIAAGLTEGPPPERALVGLGMLSLLAAAGDEQPTVCVVDDAHRLDRESLAVLGFVARRLSAESVALIFASRPDEETMRSLAGVPTLGLEGLADAAATTLLTRAVSGEIDPGVVAGIVATTGGNPLALSDLGASWTADELTNATVGHAPLPLGRRLEAHYSQVAERLPEATRRWLVVAAAENTGDAASVRAASATLELPEDASTPAEEALLVEVRDAVRFRHPLVRSAIYGNATDADRRAAHAALRSEAVTRGRTEVAAWHAAAASAGPDDAVAAELEHVALLAGSKGGLISRAHLLARAADLSPRPTETARLLVAAAEAAIETGAGTLTRQLLARVDAAALDPATRGTMRLVDAACIVYFADVSRMANAVASFVAAADDYRGVSPEREQVAMLQALNSALSTERGAAGWPLDALARRMRAAAASAPGPLSEALEAAASLALDPYELAAMRLSSVLDGLHAMTDEEIVHVAYFAIVPTVGLCDFEAASTLLRRILAASRSRGMVRTADLVLWVLSALELSRSNPRAAADFLEQARDLRRSLGYIDEQTVNAALLVWQGLPDEQAVQLEQAMDQVSLGGVARMASGAIAIRDIARGEYERATARLAALVEHPYLQASHHHVPELVEAAVRSGDLERAHRAADWLDRAAAAAGGGWIRAMALRARALLAEADSASELHRASLALLGSDASRGDRGRGRLLYGEHLRRLRHRAEAQEQLQAAFADLTAVGATDFADRARRELAALGDTTARGAQQEPGPLSAQEARIARMAAEGATNADIGAALFISPNTVDYHLRKVFRKLGVTSRRQLAEHLPRA